MKDPKKSEFKLRDLPVDNFFLLCKSAGVYIDRFIRIRFSHYNRYWVIPLHTDHCHMLDFSFPFVCFGLTYIENFPFLSVISPECYRLVQMYSRRSDRISIVFNIPDYLYFIEKKNRKTIEQSRETKNNSNFLSFTDDFERIHTPAERQMNTY